MNYARSAPPPNGSRGSVDKLTHSIVLNRMRIIYYYETPCLKYHIDVRYGYSCNNNNNNKLLLKCLLVKKDNKKKKKK